MENVEEKSNLTPEQSKALELVKEQVANAIDKDFIEDIVKSNTLEFTHEHTKYRITKANYEQKQEIYRERVKKFTELLRDKGYSLEKDLKKEYLERGIDVDAMGTKIKTLETKKESVQYKLGEMLKKEASEQDCESLKKEIEQINEDQKNLALERQTLLEFTIENQVLVHMYNYMTYVITEKHDGEKWVKAFKSFKEFMQSDETLVGKLAFLITMTFQDSV